MPPPVEQLEVSQQRLRTMDPPRSQYGQQPILSRRLQQTRFLVPAKHEPCHRGRSHLCPWLFSSRGYQSRYQPCPQIFRAAICLLLAMTASSLRSTMLLAVPSIRDGAKQSRQAIGHPWRVQTRQRQMRSCRQAAPIQSGLDLSSPPPGRRNLDCTKRHDLTEQLKLSGCVVVVDA